MSQNLLSAVVVIGALRVKTIGHSNLLKKKDLLMTFIGILQDLTLIYNVYLKFRILKVLNLHPCDLLYFIFQRFMCGRSRLVV